MDGLTSLLAEVNARIREVAGRSTAADAEWDFMCECGRPGCDTRVRLSLAAYEALLAERTPVLAPGHAQRQEARA